MTTPLDEQKIAEVNKYTGEQRFKYCVKEIVANREVWI